MRFLLALFCTFFSLQLSANNLRDSVGVENSNGNQVIIHKVAAKESYYSIARLYKVAPKDIIAYNNNVSLQIGTLLKVPTQRPFTAPASKTQESDNTSKRKSKKSKAEETVPTQASTPAPASDIIEYKVGSKETLYFIARRFDTTVEEIKNLNNLKSNSLSIGQLIKVRQGGVAKPASERVEAVVAGEAPAQNTEESEVPAVERPKIPTGRLGVTERSERGVAVWIADENLDGTKMLALHRTAPVGTIVKITNPMTGRTTFAKVVGKFTENETTKDVIIVITKATAELLGALDKRFQVSIDYGVPNE